MVDADRRAETAEALSVETAGIAESLAAETKSIAATLADATDHAAVRLRRESDGRMNSLATQITTLAGQHRALVLEVQANTTITERIDKSTAGLVEAWAAISGGLKVLNWLGKAAKWVTYIAGAITAAGGVYWMAVHGAPPIDPPK